MYHKKSSDQQLIKGPSSKSFASYYLQRHRIFSKPSRTSQMELFTERANGFQPLNILTKISIIDFRLGSEYASEYAYGICIANHYASICQMRVKIMLKLAMIIEKQYEKSFQV